MQDVLPASSGEKAVESLCMPLSVVDGAGLFGPLVHGEHDAPGEKLLVYVDGRGRGEIATGPCTRYWWETSLPVPGCLPVVAMVSCPSDCKTLSA